MEGVQQSLRDANSKIAALEAELAVSRSENDVLKGRVAAEQQAEASSRDLRKSASKVLFRTRKVKEQDPGQGEDGEAEEDLAGGQAEEVEEEDDEPGLEISRPYVTRLRARKRDQQPPQPGPARRRVARVPVSVQSEFLYPMLSFLSLIKTIDYRHADS